MNRLQQVIARMTAVRSDIEALAAVPDVTEDVTEDGVTRPVTRSGLSAEQVSDWDALNGEWDTLETERGVLQARADRLNALRGTDLTVTVDTGDGSAATDAHRANLQVVTPPNTDDIYDRSSLNVDDPNSGASYRDRAMRAIDSWRGAEPEWKESAQRLIEHADEDDSRTPREIADHILRFGNPLYVRAFKKFLRGGTPVLPLLDRDEAEAFRDGMAHSRAVNEGSVAAGQAIVPPFLDPTIILTNAGSVNPFRELATVSSITTQTWKGVTSSGVVAEWTAEAAEMTDASPTFVQPSITPVRADAYIEASFEAIEDSSLATDVAMLFADARDNLEATAFAVGTGSTQPYGIVTELQLVTASRTSATTNGSVGAVDVFALDSNLPARWRKNANFTAAKGIQNVLRALATGPSQAQSAFWVDFGGGIPSKLIGYGMYEASGMQNSLSTATASNDDVLVLGDYRSGYRIVDRIGMSIAYNPLVLGANRRPTGAVGWAAFWRVGARVVAPTAFQMLRV